MKRGAVFALAFIYLILAWVFASYGWPLVVMAVIPFGVVGALIGTLVAKAVPALMADLLPVKVQVGWQPEAMIRGIALGVGGTLGRLARSDRFRDSPESDGRGAVTAIYYLLAAGEDALTSVGGYRLEGLGAQLFESVRGDYFTILGLPLLPLLDFFRSRGAVTP